MENRYLFRGKRIDNNEWEYGLPSYDEDGKTDFLCLFSLLLSFFSFCIAGVNGLIEKQEYSLYILLFLIIIIVLLVIYLVNSNKTNARKKWKHYLKVVLDDMEKEK